MDPHQEPTGGDFVASSENRAERNPFLLLYEEIEEFLEDFSGDQIKDPDNTPVVLEPQPFVYDIAPWEDSQPESTQSEDVMSVCPDIPGIVLTPNLSPPPENALDHILDELTETFSMNQPVSIPEQRKSTADMQMADGSASKMPVSTGGRNVPTQCCDRILNCKNLTDVHDDQMKTISVKKTPYGCHQLAYRGGHQVTVGSNQTVSCKGPELSSYDHTISNGRQNPTPNGDQSLSWNQTTMVSSEKCLSWSKISDSIGVQNSYGIQATMPMGVQNFCWNPVTASNAQQHFPMGQMPAFSGDCFLSKGQMSRSIVDKNLNLGKMALYSGVQNSYGDQVTSPQALQNFYWNPMTTYQGQQNMYPVQMPFFRGDQWPSDGQVTIPVSDQNYAQQIKTPDDVYNYSWGQMTTSSDGQNLHGSQVTTPTANQNGYSGQEMMFRSVQSHSGGHMMTFRSDQNHSGSPGTSHQPLLSPYPGFPSFSSSPLIQQQVPDKNRNLKIKSYGSTKESERLKPYICPYQDCSKAYRRSSHLRIHERSHTGEKPYVCSVTGCMANFSRSDELKRHMRIHSGERPYQCTLCSKNFTRLDHLRVHGKVHR